MITQPNPRNPTLAHVRNARLATASAAATAEKQGPFMPDTGYWTASPPPGDGSDRGEGPPRKVWGSFTQKGEGATGDFTSDWYELPKNWSTGERVVTFVSGRAQGISTITAQFGRHTGPSVTRLSERPVRDSENATSWRAHAVAAVDDVPAGADVIRLVAHDGETTKGGWVAFTGSSQLRV